LLLVLGETENWRLRKKAPFDCEAMDGGAQRKRPKGERQEGASNSAAPDHVLRSPMIAAWANVAARIGRIAQCEARTHIPVLTF